MENRGNEGILKVGRNFKSRLFKSRLLKAALILCVTSCGTCNYSVDWKAFGKDTGVCALKAASGVLSGLVDNLFNDFQSSINGQDAFDQKQWEGKSEALAKQYGPDGLLCAAQHLLKDSNLGDMLASNDSSGSDAATFKIPCTKHKVSKKHRKHLEDLFKKYGGKHGRS